MPLDANIEQGHGERQATAQGRPGAMTELLEPTDGREHGQDRLHDHADVPGAPFAGLHVRRVAVLRVEAGVGQDDHLVLKIADQGMECRVRHVGCGIIPRDDQPMLVDDVRELRANDPPMVREPFGANLSVGPVFAPGMAEFDAVTVGDPQHGRFGQEDLGPVVVGLQEPKQAGALGQRREPARIIVAQPAGCPRGQGARADAFQGEQQAERHHFTGV